MGYFKAKILWVNGYNENEETVFVLVAAYNYSDAMNKIEHRFPFPINVSLEDLNESDILVLTQDSYNKLPIGWEEEEEGADEVDINITDDDFDEDEMSYYPFGRM